jgi:hypothetical protein
MGLPEYAHGYRADVALEPEDIFPIGGPSPLDALDQQESAIFASAFRPQRTSVPGPARPGHRASPDLDDDTALFAEVMR